MTIVAFGGRIASGKSSVSRGVAARFGAPWVAFGDAVRAEAKRRGIAPSRSDLQDLGDALIAEGWDAFCDRVFQQATWNGAGLLVVDGVRHVGAIDALRKRSDGRTIIVFVDASWEFRVARLAHRGVDADGARAADAHANESEVEQVRQRADVRIGNNDHIDDAVDAAIASLERLGVRSQPATK